jgi:Phosphate-selective porin O and P
MRSNILATAIVASLGLASLVAAGAAHAQAATPEQLAELKAQITALQAQVDALQTRTEAQSDINIANAQAGDDAKATQDKVDKLSKLVNDTTISGKMFFDVTNIDQTSNGDKTNASGTGIDVKRFYLGVTHQFNDIWSANLTTDFQYNSALDSAADIYVKKAYVQGKFSDAFIARAGSADLPWVPYVEDQYGFRYVENTLVDRLKFGTSADWGLHAGGNIGGITNYAVSVVNGAGYKVHTRSKSVDVEGRVAFTPVEGLVIAAGGYSGKLGKEVENTDALHTATRGDLMVAYSNSRFRLGGEYFRAQNWNNVVTAESDSASGYSVWGSVGLGTGGITAFARYDRADMSEDLDPSLQDTYYNFGVEFPITKGFKLAAVYKNTRREDDSTTDLKSRELGMWGEVKF